jgi:hypothetical protein
MPPAVRRAMTAGVLPVIAVNLFIGASVPFIDNSAHIGGLLTGAALTLIIPYIAPGRESISRTGLLIMAICLAAIVYCFTWAYRASESYLDWRGDDIESFLDGINSTHKAINQSFRASFESAAPRERAAAADSLSGAIEKLQKAGSPDQRSDQIRLELIRIARKQRVLMTSGGKMDETRVNFDDYEKAWSRLEEWVKMEGLKHGLVFADGDRQSK